MRSRASSDTSFQYGSGNEYDAGPPPPPTTTTTFIRDPGREPFDALEMFITTATPRIGSAPPASARPP